MAKAFSVALMSSILCIAACMGLAVGCAAAEDAPPRLPELAKRTVPVAKIPASTLEDLRTKVLKNFGAGPFESGQVMDTAPDVAGDQLVEDLPGELVQAFERAGLGHAQSPIIAHEAKSGAVRFIQLGLDGDDEVSLVAGREAGGDERPNDKVFRIEGRWVGRLLGWDTCMRAVAADTTPVGTCGIDGCPLMITHQRFVHPTGRIEVLLFQVGHDYPADVVVKHDASHGTPATHCNATTRADGSCGLECLKSEE